MSETTNKIEPEMRRAIHALCDVRDDGYRLLSNVAIARKAGATLREVEEVRRTAKRKGRSCWF